MALAPRSDSAYYCFPYSRPCNARFASNDISNLKKARRFIKKDARRLRRRLTPFFPTIADSPQWVLQNMPEYVEGALWRLRRGVIPRLIASRTAVHSLRAFALFCIKKSGQRLRPRRLLPPALAVPGHFPHIESVPRSLSWTNQRPVLLPQRSAQYPLYFQMHSEKRAASRPLQSRQKEDLFSALCLPRIASLRSFSGKRRVFIAGCVCANRPAPWVFSLRPVLPAGATRFSVFPGRSGAGRSDKFHGDGAPRSNQAASRFPEQTLSSPRA